MILIKWPLIVTIGLITAIAESSPTGLLKDAKADQALRPRAKRAQEVLMFGNQQNRRTTENIANTGANANANAFRAIPNSEKRTLGTSGLEDVKAALTEGETFNDHPKQLQQQQQQQQQKQQQPSFSIFDRERISPPYEKNYDYGRVVVDEMREELPRNWDILPYSRYFGMEEDRRKRSEAVNKDAESGVVTSDSPLAPPTAASSSTSSFSPMLVPASGVQLTATARPFIQAKRSMQTLYPEPRYKRALDRDDFLALLRLLENQPRAGARSWRNLMNNEEYDNMEDEANYIGQDLDEDARVGADWLDSGSLYAPSRHMNLGSEISGPSEFGIPRTHPFNSYDQYGVQYNTPTYTDNSQYGTLLYPHASYFAPEKRFIVSRKRSQAYDTYGARNINNIIGFSQLMNSQAQGYPNNLPQRLFY